MAADAAYAMVQVLHNLGAVAVVGSPAAAMGWQRERCGVASALVWLTLSGWLVQSVSGAAFGLTSYLASGEVPQIAGTALIALNIKIGCVVAAIVWIAVHLLGFARLRQRMQAWFWPSLLGAGVLALSSAAFLRWFG